MKYYAHTDCNAKKINENNKHSNQMNSKNKK